jgi:hypothetical protein
VTSNGPKWMGRCGGSDEELLILMVGVAMSLEGVVLLGEMRARVSRERLRVSMLGC